MTKNLTPEQIKALCWDQDRFGRFSPHEASYWTWPLAQAGIKLVTTNKGPIDWSNFTQWMTYSFDQHGNHQFLQKLSRDVTRGQLEAAKNGSWIGGIPYAYRLEGERKKKRLVIDDPAKARVVQRIFREYVEGRSLNNIAQRLQAEGIPSSGGRGKPWSFDTVKVILENPAYVGDYVGGRYSYGKYHTIRHGDIAKANGRCRKPEAEWIEHEDHHDAIIDRETFAEAKAILAKGKTGRSPYLPEDNPFILSEKLVCGKCGGPLWGMRGGSHKKPNRPRYYECGRAKKHKACSGCTVSERDLLLYIADHLNREFLSLDGGSLERKAQRKELKPDDLPKAFVKVKAIVSPPKQRTGDRQRMEKQAKALAEQLDKAQRNLVLLDPENIPTAQEQIRQWRTEREQLELELRKKPPTEQDVNAETLSVLRSLYWLEILFRLAAEPKLSEQPKAPGGFAMSQSSLRARLRPYLRHVSTITIFSNKVGRGNGTRYVFEKGEIAFELVGPVRGNLNPHRPG